MTAVVYLDDLIKASSRAELSGPLRAALADARGPFDRAEWWQGLAAHCGMAPVYMLAHGGEAAALLALEERGGAIRAAANWYSFRWRPLFSSDDAAEALLGAAMLELAARCWRVTLDQVPNECGSADILVGALRGAGWRVKIEAHDVNHVLRLNGRRYADYLADLPGPLRTTLKRKAGKVAVTLLDRFDDAAWDAYEEIYAASWKPSEGSPAFLRDFAQAEGAAGRLRMGLAHIGGSAVAAQFWTVEDGTAYIHKLAHREDARGQSPGTVLSAALFERVIDGDGVGLVDFGTGDNPYKRDWMNDIRPRYRIDALWPRSPRSWPRLAHRAMRG